jgi:hypothetical protein
MTKNYYYCEECQNTVEFNHECVMDKITRMDMGNAFNTWLKEQPESETSPIRKHTKALGEVSYVLEALEKENLELKHQINELQLQVGDWKDAAEQTISAARGTRLDAAGERQHTLE